MSKLDRIHPDVQAVIPVPDRELLERPELGAQADYFARIVPASANEYFAVELQHGIRELRRAARAPKPPATATAPAPVASIQQRPEPQKEANVANQQSREQKALLAAISPPVWAQLNAEIRAFLTSAACPIQTLAQFVAMGYGGVPADQSVPVAGLTAQELAVLEAGDRQPLTPEPEVTMRNNIQVFGALVPTERLR